MNTTHESIYAHYVGWLNTHDITPRTRTYKCRQILRYLEFLEALNVSAPLVSSSHIQAYMQVLGKLSPRTYNCHLLNLKQFWRFLTEHYEMRSLVRSPKPKPVPATLPRYVPLNLMTQLLTPGPEENMESLLAKRDQAILEFLFSTGVRSIELRNIRFGDVSADLSECKIRTAKKGRQRIVFLGYAARSSLQAYLFLRQEAGTLYPSDWLFLSKHGSALCCSSVARRVKSLAVRRLGFIVTPHQFRHSFATEMLRASGCLRSVQVLLGHVKIRNTGIYCALELSDKNQAMQFFHPNGSKVDEQNHQNSLAAILDKEA